MNPQKIRRLIIEPALSLLPAKMNTPQAIVMLLAITLQEDLEQRRRQWPTGPAHSLWQAEEGGGMITGLLNYRVESVRALAVNLCAARGVAPVAADVWKAIEHDDVLAAGLARLLLWTDAGRLPEMGDVAGAWSLYLRTWQPGKPRPSTWPANYMRALEVVR